jgi:hypothetical protein
MTSPRNPRSGTLASAAPFPSGAGAVRRRTRDVRSSPAYLSASAATQPVLSSERSSTIVTSKRGEPSLARRSCLPRSPISAAMTADSSRAGMITLSHGSAPVGPRCADVERLRSARRPARASGAAEPATITPPASAIPEASRDRGARRPARNAVQGSPTAAMRILTDRPPGIALDRDAGPPGRDVAAAFRCVNQSVDRRSRSRRRGAPAFVATRRGSPRSVFRDFCWRERSRNVDTAVTQSPDARREHPPASEGERRHRPSCGRS